METAADADALVAALDKVEVLPSERPLEPAPEAVEETPPIAVLTDETGCTVEAPPMLLAEEEP